MTTPDLTAYDVILVNSSAGKDSQAMLDYVVTLADAAGVKDRLVVVHCDLGEVEWEGTRDLAERQAQHYGLRFEVVSRDRDLLHQVEYERKMWPSSTARYCTSDQKTGQVAKLMTALVRELALDRPARILNCLGIRAQESCARAKKVPFGPDTSASTKTTRHVDRWLPLHEWTEEAVWNRIKASGVEHHPAYDKGMSRLSCRFCVLASKPDLLISVRENPELAQRYADIEKRINHTFTAAFSMADLIAEASA
jgi:3'-phosphoadenosine 5'-phosphosulfate sulfotransferase (PAPS reductase)/FAD synthetase